MVRQVLRQGLRTRTIHLKRQGLGGMEGSRGGEKSIWCRGQEGVRASLSAQGT